jgi:hypothetical protein
MNLKSVTLVAAITQLLVVFCNLAACIRTLMEVVSGHMEWKYNWLYLLSEPFYLLAGIALAVFLFTLFAKQGKN